MIPPKLFNLCGDVSINTYGLFIVLGILTFLYFLHQHSRRPDLIDTDTLFNLTSIGIIAAVFGARLFFVIEHYDRFVSSPMSTLFLWQGGYSVLGSLVVAPLVLMVYLWWKRIAVIQLVDLVMVHVPLLQAIARLGCFFAGCCYGIAASASSWWSVTYTHPDSLAPLCVALHPTQLYSAVLSFAIFVALKSLSRRLFVIHGMLFSLYFVLEGSARFAVDFLRGGRGNELEFSKMSIFEIIKYTTGYQMVAVMLVIGGIVGCCVSYCAYKQKQNGGDA